MTEKNTDFTLTEASSLSLNILRLIAAQLVLVGHEINVLKLTSWLKFSNGIYIQFVAIVIFFLISGFLIPYSVVRKLSDKGYSFVSYLIERFSRIYSGYLPAILLVIILDAIYIKFLPTVFPYLNGFKVKNLITNLLMLQYYPSTTFGSGRVFWTLGLWWWIYLSYGWIFINKKLRLNQPILWWGILACFLIVPVYNLINEKGQWLSLVWVMGLGIYYYLKKPKLRINQATDYLLSIIFFILSIIRLVATGKEFELGFGLGLSLSLLFLLTALQRNRNKINHFVKRFISFFAGYSFTLYLIHYTILIFFLGLNLPLPPTLTFLMIWFTSNVLSILIAKFTELKYKELATKFNNLVSSTI